MADLGVVSTVPQPVVDDHRQAFQNLLFFISLKNMNEK
jgi:hypothetical protein